MSFGVGSLVLLKIKIDDGFQSIGGLKTTRFSLNNQLIDATNKFSGNWRELIAKAGISSIAISASGINTSTESEKILKKIAFGRDISEYRLCFGSDEILEGKFLITHLETSGSYNDEESFQISMESSGVIKYSAI